MSHKMPFHPRDIQTPCQANWDEMRGNDHIRFCEHCNLNVHDVSRLTSKELRHLVMKAQGRLCVRYDCHTKTDAPPARPVHHIKRYASRVAAGALGTALGLSSSWAYHNATRLGVASEDKPALTAHLAPQPVGATASLAGRVTRKHWRNDAALKPDLLPLEGATVTLIEQRTRAKYSTLTDGKGEYLLTGLPVGTYRLVADAPDYKTWDIHDLALKVDKQLWQDALLDAVRPEILMMGGIGIYYDNPLVSTAGYGVASEVAELLDKGADIDAKDTHKEATALHVALERRNAETVRLLLARRANPNLRNDSGQTPLMLAWGLDYRERDTAWSVEAVDLLMRAGAEIDAQDDDGDTALMEAARYGQEPLVRALLKYQLALNLQNDEGLTALMLAVRYGKPENVQALLEAGADITLRDDCGQTAWRPDTPQNIRELLQKYGATE